MLRLVHGCTCFGVWTERLRALVTGETADERIVHALTGHLQGFPVMAVHAMDGVMQDEKRDAPLAVTFFGARQTLTGGVANNGDRGSIGHGRSPRKEAMQKFCTASVVKAAHG
jgi:hypothetical protein